MAKLTPEAKEIIIKGRAVGMSWEDIQKIVRKQLGIKFASKGSFRTAGAAFLNKIKDEGGAEIQKADIDIIRQNRRVSKKNTLLQKESRIVIDEMESRDVFIVGLREIVSRLNTLPAVNVREIVSNSEKECVVEVLLSDTHFGLKEDHYNYEIARKRMREFASVVIWEVTQLAATYKPVKILVGLLGDIIANYEFHETHSAVTCEAVSPIQMTWAIESIFEDFLLPVSGLAVPVEIHAVPGNHDRLTKKRPMHRPGEESLSFVIYSALQMLCEQSGLKHIDWKIATSGFSVAKIFKNHVLYEHGHQDLALSRVAVEKKIASRGAQMNTVIDFLRFGHYHELTMFGHGRAICNGSLSGQDGYATELGFMSSACQTMNIYVNTENRPTTFYRMIPVYLDSIK